jgi:hypothetical protein
VDGCLGTNPNVNSNGYTTVWKTACGIGGWQQYWRFTLWNGDEAKGRRAAYSFRHLDADGNPDGCLSVRPGAPNSGAGQQLVLAPCFASSGILYPGQLFAMEPAHLITDQKRTLALTADFGGDNEPARLDAVGSDPRSPGQSWQLRHVS